jgi:hypothetical protein
MRSEQDIKDYPARNAHLLEGKNECTRRTAP